MKQFWWVIPWAITLMVGVVIGEPKITLSSAIFPMISILLQD